MIILENTDSSCPPLKAPAEIQTHFDYILGENIGQYIVGDFTFSPYTTCTISYSGEVQPVENH